MNQRNYLAFLFAMQAMFFVSNTGAQVADPVVTVTGQASQQTVIATVTEATPGATVFYTTDGSNPTMVSGGIASEGSLLISQNSILKVEAFLSGTNTSNLVTARYTSYAAVSAGDSHSLALKNDGTVWAFGDNSYGELGTNNTTSSNTPLPVMVSGSSGLVQLGGIVAVAAGSSQSFAVDASGNVWAWGYNPNGESGTGTTGNITLPVQVTGVSGIVAIASSGYHTLALKADGTVWAWGVDTLGQIGNGTMASVVTSPYQTSLEGIVAVAAGANHSLALDNTGAVWAWGDNSYGQLGTGNYTEQSSPVLVGSSFSGVVSISAGARDSYAVTEDGRAWAWGDNSIGELGDGNTTGSTTPIQVSGVSGLVGIGDQSAINTAGALYTWGDNTYGQLGTGSIASYSTTPSSGVNLTGMPIPAASLWALIAAIGLISVTSYAVSRKTTGPAVV